MEAGVWEEEFSEAWKWLFESTDFHTLQSRGHDLKNGVVLTSVSDVPFEVSLKCMYCGIVFWFENAEWATGGMAEWHISSISRQDASDICSALTMAV